MAEEKRLHDRYEVKSVYMRTPCGQVFRAEDLCRENKAVIVKELVANASLGVSCEEIEERFARETAFLSRLAHPGVPRLVDSFRDGESYYVVTEDFGGDTIDSLSMKRNTPFPVHTVARWAIQLCEILKLLHENSPEPIIFRDITPSNIIVTQDGDVKLADFGISRYFNPVKLKDTFIMGTPGFSPPEQYGKGQSDQRSDIYSLGATLFYCLSHHYLEEFPAKKKNLLSLNPLIGRRLEKVINRCIEKEPGKRYQSVDELCDDLKGCDEKDTHHQH
jgi:serine/threonine protein kinase, bacterial